MRRQFREDMTEISDDVKQLASLAFDLIHTGTACLLEGDASQAEQVILDEELMHGLGNSLEKRVLRSTCSPTARGCRFENIGDNVAGRSRVGRHRRPYG